MNISVVIPSYNSQENLSRTLTALAEQKTTQNYEIMVVDCSDNDEVENICSAYSRVVCLREAERFNPGIGRNIGAQKAKGELLVFLDADVVLEESALENAWEYYQAGHQVFGGALELNSAVCNSFSSYLEHYFFNHESQRYRTECERSNLSSALMIFNRELFLSQGGFKNVPRMQDTELTERMRAEGIQLFFSPKVVGLQIQDSPLKKVLRKIWINGINLYFIRYQKRSFAYKVFLFLCLPLIAGLKGWRIIFRHLRYQPQKGRWITVFLSPLILISSFVWMLGIYRSLLLGGGISQHRD